MRNKLYVALCGIPDCGKSTFIKNFVKQMTGRDVAVDSLCNEEIKEMTIRSAQIVCRHPSFDNFDIVFLDCPGHLELRDEIRSCLTKADVVIILNNCENYIDDTRAYSDNIIYELNCTKDCEKVKLIEIWSHCKDSVIPRPYDKIMYDIDNEKTRTVAFSHILQRLIDIAQSQKDKLTSPLTTAKRIMMQTVANAKSPAAMVSYGKDSVVMMAIAYELGIHKQIKWYYPVSGFDMDGLSSEFIKHVNKQFDIEVEPYRVIPDEPYIWNFENKTVQEMMLKKAEMLNDQIAKNEHDFVMMGIRRDEEGVRAKEKFFSVRKNSGEANLYEQQYEEFGNEIETILAVGFYRSIEHVRVHPLLDVTEADAWLYTKEHNLPFCSEYIACDGKRYRSLGDKPITSPIKSDAVTIDEIVEEVLWTLVPERACRAAQDNAVKGNMEIIRSKGFF